MEKYTKVRKIGEGAFGKAILVNKKQNGQQYVVKEINILKMGAKEREEARKEVSVLAQLSHPNIVTYRESFEEHGSLYIVMDFCEKGDLYSKINSQRGLLISEDQIMDWFVQICLAMKHIHDRKILHRDIKSQNIFISGDGRIQLGDFGIAKVLNSTVELARTCIGTPYYLSPEICENRPYNNKSDIWSLGCVLYEMTTLKHAFEAGNMKNLVLKIIRGSYPPIPPKYSYELRGLIAKLFKRTPKDRPSINSVLKQNFVTKRVAKFLSEEQMQSEFSHTVMHGKKINARALPPPPPSSRPPSARKTPLPGAPKPTPKYNPAAVYGAPQVRKSKENRSSVDGPRKRPGSANSAGRPGSANSGGRPGSANQDVKKKKQEMVDRENKRREEAKKAAERKHKELIEKQKLARINKAREENWKSMVDSLESDRKNIEKNQPKEQIQWHQPRPADNVNRNNLNVGAAKERGKYDQYHAYLDKLQRDRDTRDEPPKPAQPSHAYMAAPRPLPIPAQPVPKWHRPGSGRTPDPTPIYGANPQANRDRRLDAKAAERAKIVDDFIQRKKEAAMNKQRGKMDIFGNPSPEVTPRNDSRPSSARDQPQGQSDRDREEQEYLERLRQIRKQNYNERRGIQLEQQAKREAASQAEAEARKKKIEALRQQADDRAKQLKKQLEEQRKNQYEKEKARINRPVPAPRPVMKPAPAASITAALNAVGVEPKLVPKGAPASPAPGITGALHAIGVESRSSQDTEAREKSVFQQQKDEILRRVNEKSNREKWGGSDKSVGDKDGSPDTARSKWGEDGSKDMLKDVPLEMTASQMDATTNEDQVIKKPELEKGDIAAEVDAAVNRRQWGRPGSTVLKALNQAPIMEGSLTVNSDKSDNRDQEKSSGEVSRSQWGGKRESVLDRLKQAPIINNTISSDKSELIDQEQSEQTGSEEEVKLRRQWGGKRDSLLDRLKAKSLLRDSLVSDSERTKQIGSEEEVKLRSQWGGKRFSLLDRLKIKSLQDDSLVPEKEESKQNLSEEEVKLRSHWGGKRESVLERLKAKSLLEDSPDPENEGSEQIRPEEKVMLRSQWGGKRESVLDRLKAKSLIEDSLVFEKEGSQQIACTSEEEVKLRRHWGGKRESVLDRLQAKSLMRDSLVSDESVENKSSPEVTKQPSTAIGTTITIAKTPIQKGTITIQKSNVNSADLLQRPDVSQHISESNQKSESSAHDTETVQLHQDIDSSSQSETVSVTSKPPVPTKPAIPSKPDILPKPVILQKPDEPMNFGDTVPQSVNLKGEGELFNKVETEEKELEKPRSGVIMGLFTGNFDMGNAKMLRTCSEPDLVRLFKTLESHVEQKPLRKSVDVNQLQGSARMLDNVELDDDSGPEKSPSPTKGDNQEEEEDDIVDDEDYEDLLSVRETMASLLLRECSTDDESSHHNTGKFSLPSNKDSDIMEEDDNNKDVDDNDNDGNVDDENEEEKAEKADYKEKEVEDGNDDGNDATEAEEYQRNLEEIVDEDGDEEDIDDQDADGEIASPSIEDLFQSDDSDADTQFGDDEEDYDLFSRLEESRAELETELGCDKFLKIYKTVQALQEDEDENMEDGIVIVTKLLGKDKEHLYPKIFQLVMADAAFQEEQSALNENGRS